MSAISERSRTVIAGPKRVDADDAILIVEDDEDLSRLIAMCLATHDYPTVSVTTGAAALAWLKRNSPRLILLDYSLPDMRGEQLIEEIKARGRRVPFVVTTGHGSESVAVSMMKHGAYDYLVKGTMFLKLLPAVVNRALELAQQSQRLIQAEAQLFEAHEDLELRVQQRTAELAETNDRLRVEMKERRRAEAQVQQHLAELAHVARLSTVGEMVAELAHELNQPLSAISSYAQACQRLLSSDRSGNTEDMLVSLDRVNEQANRAAEIIRRLRRFVAKAEPQDMVLDMNELLHSVVDLTNIDARMADVEVCFELTEPLPPVMGDRIQLEQVLVNLMRNAFEATCCCEPQRRRLTLRTAIADAHRIVVDVCDNGAGIPPEVIGHVFERLFSTKPNGMGLGLPISQSIIEHHGGTLWCTPNSDRGSTFHFTLPINSGEPSRGS
jgi:C4-dicarboxylate-specific signal transduction histidine kinase